MQKVDNKIQVPLSLYIHIPWCVRKCPYCDFNSHTQRERLPEAEYVKRLIEDFTLHYQMVQQRPLSSIFFGGGTPSLFTAASIEKILEAVMKEAGTVAEITLEANPGTFEQQKFKDFKSAGITRISLGVQSFNTKHLKALGRVHSAHEAKTAIESLTLLGFDNWNIDLMFGLPSQTIFEAMQDLQIAIDYQPPHLSWYQLTLEPNTPFFHNPPPLPNHDKQFDMHEKGHELLALSKYKPYEVSAFTQTKPCRHNINYWEFGDYLGIGAGAHSKITYDNFTIERQIRFKHPKDYLNINKPLVHKSHYLTYDDIPFEFMLNSLRLNDGFSLDLFRTRTGLPSDVIHAKLKEAEGKALIHWNADFVQPTTLGKLHLNDLMEIFLPYEHNVAI